MLLCYRCPCSDSSCETGTAGSTGLLPYIRQRCSRFDANASADFRGPEEVRGNQLQCHHYAAAAPAAPSNLLLSDSDFALLEKAAASKASSVLDRP